MYQYVLAILPYIGKMIKSYYSVHILTEIVFYVILITTNIVSSAYATYIGF